jgi:hypothetical protein
LRARRYHILVLLLPHKRHTFDYCHPVTALAHLVDDFKAEMGEDDLTHLPEILVLRDLERDPDGGEHGVLQGALSAECGKPLFTPPRL